MKYIGNYASWINDDWIEWMLVNDGTPRPSGGSNPDSEEFNQASQAGYDLSKTYWYIYEPHTFPYDIESPIEVNGNFIWWFIKMLPGQFMPMHKDPHAVHESNSKRYWMPLQDYEPGHVFINENELSIDYKKGDLFEYNESDAIHGSCNIGWTPRLILNFSTFDLP